MMNENAYAIILAGGSGTRLWPMSRNLLPKQLLTINGQKTLLQQTVERAVRCFPADRIWIVTNEEHAFAVRAQAESIDPVLGERVLSEPEGRNTLPAALLGLEPIVDRDEEAVVAVFPSDHLVLGEDGWNRSLRRAVELAFEDNFVTFGIRPDKPETGYGYICVNDDLGEGAHKADCFVEKPDYVTAMSYIDAGTYLWNSGMFLFKAANLLKDVERFQPELWEWWLARGEKPLVEGYGDIPSISLDYGVAEKADNIAVVEAAFDWDDLGSWEAMYRRGRKDGDGNVIQGEVMAKDCHNCLLISEGRLLSAVGLDNMVMVQTGDATFSSPLGQSHRVQEIVSILKEEGSSLVDCHLTVYRPWGSYTVLEEKDNYKSKRIVVNPGERLSSQMHHHRAEHWTVIAGTAIVEVDHKEIKLEEGESVDIPKTAQHRLSNLGEAPLEIVEVQSGSYLGEDDIVRFDDIYGRTK